MDGCLKREQRAIERDLVLAWRIANFTPVANAGKLKSAKHYLDQMKPQHAMAPAVEAAAAFQSLANRGLVTIREVPRKDDNGG